VKFALNKAGQIESLQLHHNMNYVTGEDSVTKLFNKSIVVYKFDGCIVLGVD
jgi:hypothetical protein